jgi:hypothetical protein
MKKKILVVGGTQMIGRNFVEFLLLNNEYDISIANRGITNAELFNNTSIKHIKIDRNNLDSCKILNNQNFDIVVDFSCYNVLQLKAIINHVKYKKYFLLSTLCVNSEEILSDKDHWLFGYCTGKKKVEQYIISRDIKNISIIRPCVIYGKHDYTGRFYEKDNQIYWTKTNELVEGSKYYLDVNEFTKILYNYITDSYKNLTDNINIIEINGDHKLPSSNKYNKIQNYKLHPKESKYIDIKQYTDPFNYIVIDNLFNQDVYKKICDKFPSFISRTVQYKDQPGATSNYAGYISGLSLNEMTDGYDLFASTDLQNFVEKSFNIKTSKYISPSAHFHKAPSQNGFIHRDMNICSFSTKQSAGDFMTCGDVFYTDDTVDNPNSIKMIRSIALLYYLNNDDSINSNGGGTGIYDGYNGKLIKTIEPKNNRLFIFEISHNSFHGFIGANFDRSAIVSWFHSSPAYIVNRNWKHYRKNKNYIEKWTQKPIEQYWKIESDPNYGLYFNKPLKDLL